MNIDDHARWHAVGDWRDRIILEAARLLNRAGAASLADFENALPQAGMIDSVWDPASFAAEPLDAAMHRHARGEMTALLARAADELAGLNPGFVALADGVAEAGEGLHWPDLTPAPPAPSPAPVADPSPAPDPAGGRIARLTRTLAAAGTVALGTAVQLGDAAGRSFKDRTGMDDRLRGAARARLASRWLGTGGEPRPMLGQIIALADQASTLARSAM